MLYSFGQRRQWERVTKVLDRMQAKGLTPTVDAYDSLVGAYADADLLQPMEQTLKTMREADMSPGMKAYMAALAAYSRSAQWEQLDATMRAMLQAGLMPDADGWGMLLAAYESNDEVRETRVVYAFAGAS
jgi:pentatricopeptide repeat protein